MWVFKGRWSCWLTCGGQITWRAHCVQASSARTYGTPEEPLLPPFQGGQVYISATFSYWTTHSYSLRNDRLGKFCAFYGSYCDEVIPQNAATPPMQGITCVLHKNNISALLDNKWWILVQSGEKKASSLLFLLIRWCSDVSSGDTIRFTFVPTVTCGTFYSFAFLTYGYTLLALVSVLF